ncbi:hypothetical protein [Tropicimonas isoalkanivorans]|uniref:Uncharacterized protein n=1 Tax=Tropicimonas isoalkanivorans TaxID=441112 RepID=A0A1I1QAN4_9RHOB|nr:hypothetical protein [Tropicimonas isoalkanivorans]SFD19196.1 hypothetical protein SAMN04488094_11944 [Tropicimonas isoalkanivorans]
MPHTRRWMQSVFATVEMLDTQLPWERGTRRAEWIARRTHMEASSDAMSA